MNIRTAFPYETRHEDLRIPVPDGAGGSTRLYARVWRPVTDAPVPALLEYLPYRQERLDRAPRRPASPLVRRARLRLRTGRRCAATATARACRATPHDATEHRRRRPPSSNWLAGQPWCTGRVGMFGICWGGPQRAPDRGPRARAARGVVTVCSTDDPYDNDGHYLGGAVLGLRHARLGRAPCSPSPPRPPDPPFVGDDAGADVAGAAGGAGAPRPHLAGPPDPRRLLAGTAASARTTAAVEAAVLAVGGWHDPYRDTVLRLVEHLDPARVRGLIGPWSHQYPDRGLPPGPAIGFLQETLRWWDHWLRDTDTDTGVDGRAAAALLDQRPACRPPPSYEEMPGRWVGRRRLALAARHPVTYSPPAAPPLIVDSPQHTGLDAGRFFPFGNDADLPPGPARRGRPSVCFDFALDGRPRGDPGPAPGTAAAAHGRPVGPGRRTALRRGPRRLLHPRHPRRPRPLGPARPRPRRRRGRPGVDRGRRPSSWTAPATPSRPATASGSPSPPRTGPGSGPGPDSAGFTLDPAGSRPRTPRPLRHRVRHRVRRHGRRRGRRLRGPRARRAARRRHSRHARPHPVPDG